AANPIGAQTLADTLWQRLAQPLEELAQSETLSEEPPDGIHRAVATAIHANLCARERTAHRLCLIDVDVAFCGDVQLGKFKERRGVVVFLECVRFRLKAGRLRLELTLRVVDAKLLDFDLRPAARRRLAFDSLGADLLRFARRAGAR